MTATSNHKICADCENLLAVDNFNRDRSKKDGRRHICRTCDKARIRARVRIIPATKVCRSCREEKPRKDFNRSQNNLDGLQGLCNVCQREFRGERGTLYREIRRRYRVSEAGQLVDYQIRMRRRAARARLPHIDYDPVDIYEREGGLCNLCAEPVDKFHEVDGQTRRAFHVEHIIPLQADPDVLSGYGIENPGDVPWNVAVAHPACNAAKGNRVGPDVIDQYELYRQMYGPDQLEEK